MNIYNLILFLFLNNQVLFAQDCVNEKYNLQKGLELYNEGQFLLSSIHFVSADSIICKNKEVTERASIGYIYSIHRLGERSEAFRSASKLEQNLTLKYQQKISGFKSFYYNIEGHQEFETRKNMFQDLKLKQKGPKNPWIAGGLSSLVPGSGQLYTGAYQSAIVAFTLNALFYSSTLELQKKGLQSTSLASGLIFSIVYIGNIFNAANSSQIYNENYHRSANEEYIKRNFPELSP